MLGFLVPWGSLVLLFFGLVLVFPVVLVLYFLWVYLEIHGLFVVLGGILFHVRRCFHVSLGSWFCGFMGHKHGAHFRVAFVAPGVVLSR